MNHAMLIHPTDCMVSEMQKLLEEQLERILKREQEYEIFQLELFNRDKMRQLKADRRHWRISGGSDGGGDCDGSGAASADLHG
jgi:hypothetical protein